MRGEQIIARAYSGKPLVRRIWAEGERIVYIVDDKEFQRLTNEVTAIGGVGFPREDIFIFDEKVAKSMERLYQQGKWDWSKLMPWKSK